MKKQKILKFLNIFLIFGFLVAALSLIFYKFVPTELQGSELMYETHEIAGIIFIVLGVSHFILNFNWIKMMYFKKKKK